MNKNIEVINENLYAVNMSYIKQGYMQELQLLPDSEPLGNVEMTDQGVILIDQASPIFPALRFAFGKVMEMQTWQLKKIMKDNSKKIQDNFDDLIIQVVGWELRRRAYIEKLEFQKKHTVINKIICRIKKEGEKVWQLFKLVFSWMIIFPM